jgi:hypothetical protein
MAPQLTIVVPIHMAAAMQAANPHAKVVAERPQLIVAPPPRK